MSQKIASNAVHAVDWSDVKYVHCYRPMAESGEVDTAYLVKLLHELPIRPIIDFVEPQRNAPIPAKQYDVVIVPVLGFNKHRHRLGWGGGWYDRFLATQSHALTIGLAYEAAFVDFTDEPHDIALNVIATENKTV